MNKTSRSKLYKKFGLNPKKATPGQLLEKSRNFHPRKHKRAPMGDEPSMRTWRPVKGGFNLPQAGAGSGVGRAQKASMPTFGPTAPKTSAIAPMAKSHKMHKTMCKMCGKKHAKNDHDADDKKHKTHKKNWIAGAIKHPGALHRELGIKQGHKIPASRLRAAAKKGGKEGQRARLAETLKSFHHKRK